MGSMGLFSYNMIFICGAYFKNCNSTFFRFNLYFDFSTAADEIILPINRTEEGQLKLALKNVIIKCSATNWEAMKN